MTLRNLEIFVAVVELGSMSAAARELVITQSSVSQVILDIEKDYGINLFERFNRGLKLTPTGEEMLKYAKNIILLNKELDSVLNHESKVLRIRLGATATIGATVMKAIVLDLQREYPKIKCEVSVANTRTIEEKIMNNELDVGLVEGNISNDDLIQEVAMRDKMVFICGCAHRLCGRTSIKIEEVRNDHWVMREAGSGTRAQVMRELKAHNIQPDIRWCCNSLETVKSAVADGIGVSVLSRRLVKGDFEDGKLWISDISNADFERTFKLVYHKDKYMTKTMKSFVNLCYRYGNESKQ